MAGAYGAAKKKFPDLFGGKGEESDTDEDGGEEGAEDEGEEVAEEEDEGGYDLKACANDIMAAVKANDVDALEEALEELMKKVK